MTTLVCIVLAAWGAEVGPEDAGTVDVVLKRPGARVALATESGSGFAVHREFTDVCASPCSVPLPAGPVRLRLTAAGAPPYEEHLRLLPGETVRVSGTLGSRPLVAVGTGIAGAAVALSWARTVLTGVLIVETVESGAPSAAALEANLVTAVAAGSGLVVGTTLIVSGLPRVRIERTPGLAVWAGPNAVGVVATF